MKKILAFGEVLWDLLPSGKQIGGAPGNFAFHARRCGADARIVSRVGSDRLGDEVFDVFRNSGVPTDFLGVDPERPTGTVEVALTSGGQPSYTIVEDVAWDRIRPDSAALRFARTADALCFGSLACRSAENLLALKELLAVAPKSAAVIFDLNLRKPFYTKEVIAPLLARCDVFKLNDDELLELAAMFGGPLAPGPFFAPDAASLAPDKRAYVERLIADFGLRTLILTCGSKGSFLFAADGRSSFCETTAVQVVSTVGAGDAFTAVCAAGLLLEKPLDLINAAASRYAASVCTAPGGMPDVEPVVW